MAEQEAVAEFEMWNYENRLATFQTHSWPFTSDCSCTPENMAKAGFFHVPTTKEPDLARCFVCQKELDGWEADDDPWQEHKKHSGRCPFLSLRKDILDLSVKDFLALELKRQVMRAAFMARKVKDEAKEKFEAARCEITNLAEEDD